jgi:hypothetical protein
MSTADQIATMAAIVAMVAAAMTKFDLHMDNVVLPCHWSGGLSFRFNASLRRTLSFPTRPCAVAGSSCKGRRQDFPPWGLRDHSRAKDRGLAVENWAGPPPCLEAAPPNREGRMTETFAAAVNRRDCVDDRISSRLINAIGGLT